MLLTLEIEWWFKEIFQSNHSAPSDQMRANPVIQSKINTWYVTGWWCNNHLKKYEFVNGKDYPIISHILWKIKNVPTSWGFTYIEIASIPSGNETWLENPLWSLTGKIIELVDVKNCYVWLPEVYWVEGKIYGKRYCDPNLQKNWSNNKCLSTNKRCLSTSKKWLKQQRWGVHYKDMGNHVIINKNVFTSPKIDIYITTTKWNFPQKKMMGLLSCRVHGHVQWMSEGKPHTTINDGRSFGCGTRKTCSLQKNFMVPEGI